MNHPHRTSLPGRRADEPQQADALHLRGLSALRQGDLAAALKFIRQAIRAAPRTATFHNSLGIVHQQSGRIDKAQAAFREACRLDPSFAPAHNNLGDLLEAQGRLPAAEEAYRRALTCHPDFAEAHNNLGQLLNRLGRFQEAAQHLSAAVTLKPDYGRAYYNLSVALKELGLRDDATAALIQAVRLQPDLAQAWHDLGIFFLEKEATDDALAAFEQAISLDPQLIQPHINAGNIHYERGLSDEARRCNERAYAHRPLDALKVRTALMLPGFYDSVEQLEEVRAQFESDLNRLMQERLRIADPLHEVAVVPFYLAYQGRNDVELLSRTADLFLKCSPGLAWVAPHCRNQSRQRASGRIEIGFISSFFSYQQHILNRAVSGVIKMLPRDRFRVTLLHLDTPCPEILRTLGEGDRLLRVPRGFLEARERIAEAQLDILFYTDLGMEPWTYFLAHARLAPIQVTGGGHPLTSGVPTIDYFISTAIDELPHAQQHYRERAVLLADRPVCFRPAGAPPLKTRSDYGLPEQPHLYLCPMTPFKLHPLTDRLFAEILRRDPKGELILVTNSQQELWRRLRTRFARTMADCADRIRFLPHQSLPDFIGLLRLADVVLDTPAFCGGTTSLETLAVGTPIVTLPGELCRQRSTFGFYNRMGLTEYVPQNEDDYARLAVRLASESDFRAHLSAGILARNHVLFEQRNGVAMLGDFLAEAWELLPDRR